jgi:hypothetical protein
LGASLRTAFILLQEGLWEIYHGLSGPEQDDVRALLAGIQERWGWKETYEDGAGEDSLMSAQQTVTTPGPEVLVGRSPSDPSFGPENSTPGENLWRREGDTWMLAFANRVIRLRHANGFRYIAELIAKKGQLIQAAEVEQSITGRPRAGQAVGTEVLDQEAIQNYKSRSRDLCDELEEAKELQNVARQEEIQREIEALETEVLKATGLGRRKRKMGNDADRIRKAVSNAITRAIEAIEKEHPHLARHLESALIMGHAFSYRPEVDIDWIT